MFQNKKPVIAIDGTAGSGKGTLAKKLLKFLTLIIWIQGYYIEYLLMSF